jgi:hypothetical protein
MGRIGLGAGLERRGVGRGTPLSRYAEFEEAGNISVAVPIISWTQCWSDQGGGHGDEQ